MYDTTQLCIDCGSWAWPGENGLVHVHDSEMINNDIDKNQVVRIQKYQDILFN